MFPLPVDVRAAVPETHLSVPSDGQDHGKFEFQFAHLSVQEYFLAVQLMEVAKAGGDLSSVYDEEKEDGWLNEAFYANIPVRLRYG